jgi:hypothetical protein
MDFNEELDQVAAFEVAALGGAHAATQAGGQAAAQAGGQAAAQARTSMRWTNSMSSFVLSRMCELISSGVRTDKGFKEVHLNQVAKALKEFIGNEVTGTQVYNHLRKWWQRWIRVSKLRDLSGAQWDEDTSMISLEEEHYNGHVQVCYSSTMTSFFLIVKR